MSFVPIGKKSQGELLIEHFKKVSSISALEAAGMYRIRSLSRRINDLEARGCRFAREQKIDPSGQRYVRYHILKTPPASS